MSARPDGLSLPWKIYFLRSGRHIKIGRTQRDIRERAYELKYQTSGRFTPTGSYYSLGHIVGPHYLEKRLHARFKPLRITYTEWFRIAPELTEYIAENAVEPLGRVA